MQCDYTMDPCGDVIITLHNPNIPLVVWAQSPSDHPTEPVEEEARPISFLVSSRHVTLASTVFNAMLSGGWAEGKKDQNSTKFHVDAHDWDAEAFTIAMNVLHGRCQQVPRTVTLELLGKLALIVDYYKIHEPFQIISGVWINSIRSDVPNHLGPTAVLFMLVSFVFEDAEVFSHVTKVAILRGREDLIIPENIPIPPLAIDKINETRRELMGLIAAGLHKLRIDYSEGSAGCDFTCSAVQLGALIKSLHAVKFWDQLTDSLKSPFGDHNLVEVLKSLADTKNPAWSPAFSSRSYFIRHKCENTGSVGMTVFKLGLGEDSEPTEDAIKSVASGLVSPVVAKVSQFLAGVRSKMGGLRLADYVTATEIKGQN